MQIQRIFPSKATIVRITAINAFKARCLRVAMFQRPGLSMLVLFATACTWAIAAAAASAQTTSTDAPLKSAAVAANSDLVEIRGSFIPSTDADIGGFSSANMTVSVVLAPSNQAEMDQLLADVYDPASPRHQQWLATGEFNTRFAPSAAQIAAVKSHLESKGLVIEESSSPFLVRASGPSSTVEAAFATNLHSFRNAKGVTYFANASAIKLPTELATGVLGVVGFTNTIRLQATPKRALTHSAPPTRAPFCDTPYPSATEIFADVSNNISFGYFGYGDGPLCSGLTPSQDNAIYGAPHLGKAAKGRGASLAVYELAAYQHSDIDTWAHQFYGPDYTPPLVDVKVDGGPLSPKCPVGDECVPGSQGYFGDVEVDADIEMSLAIAPAASQMLVYFGPVDQTGQTELDVYYRIAKDNVADVISSSWSGCENDTGAGYAQAENVIFEQMALQGQSMFAASGDTGAFGCIRSNGTTLINASDPGAQPWVTSVGGTSFFTFNPGAERNPDYPTGVESVWNVDGLCSNAGPSADNDNQGGFFWCANTGAGGGGSSQFWGRPAWQVGPGIQNGYTTYGNGSTHCSLAKIGTPCREFPDVSANADGLTPYSTYCTPAGSETYSDCAQPPIGWFGLSGTSLSSPMWSAIIADHDGYWQSRIGNANPFLYRLYNADYQGFFHDITGRGPSDGDTIFPSGNGFFPATPGYDLSTGIGTPKIGALITGSPDH
jgi:kumamolisin